MMSTLLAQLGGVGEEVFLGFQIPEAVMGFAEAVELGIDRVGLAPASWAILAASQEHGLFA